MDGVLARFQRLFQTRILAIDQELAEAFEELAVLEKRMGPSKRLALCMGKHDRLGGACPFQHLPEDMLLRIVEEVERV